MQWKVTKFWHGQDVYILGGGPSITQQFNIPQQIIDEVMNKEKPSSAYSPYMKKIHDKNVIGINSAFRIGNWIDILFFGDIDFYNKFESELLQFKNMKVTCRNELKDNEYVYALKKDKTVYGISNDPETVCWNFNSGASAISLAANAGAKRIFLLGFDMKKEENNLHWWHTYYFNHEGKVHNPTFEKHLNGFEQIAKDAEKRNIEIINVNPDSAIEQFKKVNLDEIL